MITHDNTLAPHNITHRDNLCSISHMLYKSCRITLTTQNSMVDHTQNSMVDMVYGAYIGT